MPEKLLIRHVDPGSLPDGWHSATIASFHPWHDHGQDKAAIYFQIMDPPFEKVLLVWYCPLVATRKNKTGKLLAALNIQIAHGQETDITSLQGCTLQIFTWQAVDETGRVIIISDFKPSPKGE